MENKIFTLHKTVTEADTAAHVGSGSLPVLATPVLSATSVGTEMNMRHTAASPVGMKVTVTAELTAVEGRILSFKVYAEDTAGAIGEGSHTRAVIRAERFMEKTNAKLAQ